MSIRLTSQEINLISQFRGTETARVLSKKGKLIYEGSIEDCIWYCKKNKAKDLTIDLPHKSD